MAISKQVPASEIGQTGLRTTAGGYLVEEFLPQLRGDQALRVFREMRDNDAIINSILFAIEMLLRRVAWHIEPAGDSPADEEAAAYLESVKDDMSHSWEDFISEVLSMLPFGWSYFEVVYKQRLGDRATPGESSRYTDGRIGVRKLAVRSQESRVRWELDPQGGVKGMWQRPVQFGREVLIPIEKALLFRTTSTKNSPEGRSILRGAYRAWWFRKRLEEIEAIGVERDLAGLPVMRIPSANIRAADDVFTAAKRIVTRTKRDEQEGLVLPSDRDPDTKELLQDFMLLSTGGRRALDTDAIIGRYAQHCAMVVLADFVLLGHEKVGSFALSSDKTDLFAVALGAWLDSIEAVLNRHLVPRLFRLNDLRVDDPPAFRHGDLEQRELREFAETVLAYSNAGFDFTESEEIENLVREQLGFPELTEEELQAREEEQALAEERRAALASMTAFQPAPDGQPTPDGQRGG